MNGLDACLCSGRIPKRATGCIQSGGKHRSRRICPTRLVTMCVGAIHECLIGEIELRSPVGNSTPSELIPLLIDNSSDWISPTTVHQPAWYHGKMLLILLHRTPAVSLRSSRTE